MRIIFDLRNVGLGNNGGSLTLIKSANVLQELGHKVYVVDSGRNQHTWEPLKAEHIRPRNDSTMPDADIIIATGYKSVIRTVKSPERCGRKVHWIRAWETWQTPESKIISNILKAPTIKIVNSLGLKRKLKKYGVKSEIIRPGYDLEDLKPTNSRGKGSFILGGLYPSKKHEKIKRSSWVIKTYKYFSSNYSNIELWMFGNDPMPNGIVDRYFEKPTIKEKQYFYNQISVWLSPAIQEGLHMPPAEAMMTGCPVVGVEAELSGTHDYLEDGITGIVTPNELKSFILGVEKLYNDKILRKAMGKQARKRIEKLGDREKNMSNMIKYFKGLLK